MMEFTHIANPVHVTAIRIEEVADITIREHGCGQSSPTLMLRLADGQNYRAAAGMTARYVPVAGDYVVRQEDGYEYLNPKDVFERKYRVIGAGAPSDSAAKAAFRSRADEDQLRAMALEYASRHYCGGSAQVVSAAETYFQFLKGAA